MNDCYEIFEWDKDLKKIQLWAKQFIDIKSSIETFKKTGDRHNITHRLVAENIPQWISEIFSLELNHIQLFSAQPRSVGFIHKDGIDRKCAFNIPVLGGEVGLIEYFDETFIERSYEDSFTYIRLAETESKDFAVKDSISNQNPVLLNTDKWHRVNNLRNPNWRHVFSFRFKNNPDFPTVSKSLNFKKLQMQE